MSIARIHQSSGELEREVAAPLARAPAADPALRAEQPQEADEAVVPVVVAGRRVHVGLVAGLRARQRGGERPLEAVLVGLRRGARIDLVSAQQQHPAARQLVLADGQARLREHPRHRLRRRPAVAGVRQVVDPQLAAGGVVERRPAAGSGSRACRRTCRTCPRPRPRRPPWRGCSDPASAPRAGGSSRRAGRAPRAGRSPSACAGCPSAASAPPTSAITTVPGTLRDHCLPTAACDRRVSRSASARPGPSGARRSRCRPWGRRGAPRPRRCRRCRGAPTARRR